MSDPPHVKPPSFWLSFTIGIFGISSWITYNGLWVELPLLVTELPEGWTLPTYLVIVSQAANLGPLLYLGLQRLLSRRIECHRLERGAIYLILCVGVVSCLVLAFFWRYGIVGEHSVLFLTFAFLMATVDCCSSVTFLPYMASYAQAYMTALYIGEGCSGLLPGLLALIQGVGGEPICVNVTENVSSESSLYPVYPAPRFSVGVFLCFLAAMVVASGVAFFLLEHWPDFQRHRSVGYVRQESPGEIRRLLYDGEQSTGSSHSSSTELLRANQDYGLTRRKELPSMSSTMLESSPRGAGRSLFWRLTSSSGSLVVVYVVVAWLNFLSNGFLSSLQSYTTMPYSVFVYHLAATLTNVVNPLACVLTFVWQIRNFRVLLLQESYTFFADSSQRRWALLKEFSNSQSLFKASLLDEALEDGDDEGHDLESTYEESGESKEHFKGPGPTLKTLKSLSGRRWAAKANATAALLENQGIIQNF